MKRIVMIVAIVPIALCLFSPPALAAGLTAKGARAGVNLANMIGGGVDTVSTVRYRTGIVGGIFAEYGFSDFLAVQPELLYSMKGVRYESLLLSKTWSTSWKFDYLEIPILAKIRFPARENVTSWIVVGPAPAILLSAKRKWEYEGLPPKTDDVRETTKSFDVGFTAGAGFGVPAGKGTLAFDGRYTLGTIATDDSGADKDTRNGVVTITVGYSL